MEHAIKPAMVRTEGQPRPLSRDEAELAAIATGAWDGIERRKTYRTDFDEIRGRLVGQLHTRRFAWRVLMHFGVFVLATLAAFGACWIAALVLRGAAISVEVRNAVEIGCMFASGAAAVFGAVVSWRVGWRSFFVGWLVGGKLFLAAALLGLL